MRVSAVVQRRLALAIAPFVLATAIALAILWPSGDPLGDPDAPPQPPRYSATVTRVTEQSVCDIAVRTSLRCYEVEADVEGRDTDAVFSYSAARGSRAIEEGDRIIVARPGQPAEVPPGADPPPEYFFVDFQRSTPLIVLAALFAVVVVALSRWRGLAALVGLAVSIAVLMRFVLPAILEGSNPLAVSIVGAAAIMFAALYLAHGFNARTTTAVLGTLASLALTGLLSLVFVRAAHFTGLASEEATFLQVSADQVNLTGLLLGGIVIGALGVLDDVTVTQASAVWELHAANPEMSVRRLYRSAVNIGRDHIASTVNTLVLAYAGASLPLLILFTISNRALGEVLTGEVIAEELVRTLVGSIGLVASVPITTILAALVVAGDHEEPRVRVPKAEREWRQS